MASIFDDPAFREANVLRNPSSSLTGVAKESEADSEAKLRGIINIDRMFRGADPIAGPVPDWPVPVPAPTTTRRGGGGGYGGGPVGPSPEVIAAYRALLESIQYDDAPLQRLEADIRAAGETGRERVRGISSDLARRAQATRGSVNEGFQRRRAALDRLASDFSRGQAAENAGYNRVLNAFDAGSVAAQNAPLQNLFNAQRSNLGQYQGIYDTSLADRAGFAGSLADDVSLGMEGTEQGLLSRVAAQRAAGTQGVTDRRNQIMLEAARQGIDLS